MIYRTAHETAQRIKEELENESDSKAWFDPNWKPTTKEELKKSRRLTIFIIISLITPLIIVAWLIG